MKYLIILAVFILGVLVGKMDATAMEVDKFEIVPGCMFTSSKARCVVENKSDETIRCHVKITGKNKKTPVASHVSNVPIQGKRFIEIDLLSDGLFTSVDGLAVCQKAI